MGLQHSNSQNCTDSKNARVPPQNVSSSATRPQPPEIHCRTRSKNPDGLNLCRSLTGRICMTRHKSSPLNSNLRFRMTRKACIASRRRIQGTRLLKRKCPAWRLSSFLWGRAFIVCPITRLWTRRKGAASVLPAITTWRNNAHAFRLPVHIRTRSGLFKNKTSNSSAVELRSHEETQLPVGDPVIERIEPRFDARLAHHPDCFLNLAQDPSLVLTQSYPLVYSSRAPGLVT